MGHLADHFYKVKKTVIPIYLKKSERSLVEAEKLSLVVVISLVLMFSIVTVMT